MVDGAPKRPLSSPPILLITDRSQAARAVEDVVTAAFDGGCRWVSLREKDLSASARRRLAETLLKRAEPYKARVGVHEDVALAASLGLRGLHLPAHGDVQGAKRSVDPRCLIGKSCHSDAEISVAVASGADYASLSPIFLTRSKPDYGPAVGLERLAAIAASSDLPLIALGGVTPEHVAACRQSGAKGIAVMGEIMRADDPARVMRAFVDAWAKA